MVITDSFHSDIEGKNYKFGTPNKLNKTSKPLILFYFVQDYKRTWDEANPLNYDDPQLKNDAIVTKIESEGDVLNISLFDYESLDETELRFEVGKETSVSKVVDENDHTKEYKFIPTKIVVDDSLEKGSKIYDELIETVWTNYYIKNSKEGEKIPKVAENVENLAAEGHSHNKSSYKKCAECSDSVFELEEEICFECSSFGAEYAETFEAQFDGRINRKELDTLYSYVEYLENKCGGNQYDEFIDAGLDPYRTNDAETFEDMKIKYDNRDRIFFIKSVDYDTDGEIENDELPQEFTIKIPSEYHYFDEDADEGDITDVLNEWISTETGFSTKGIVWVEEENNSWRKNAETFEAQMNADFLYYYVLNEKGESPADFDTLEEAQAYVANSNEPLEIYERRSRDDEADKMDKKMNAETFGAESEMDCREAKEEVKKLRRKIALLDKLYDKDNALHHEILGSGGFFKEHELKGLFSEKDLENYEYWS